MERANHSSLFAESDESEVSRNKRSIPWIRLEDALHTEGCPICAIVNNSARRHLISLLYEYVLDVSVRKRLHASFGFCNHHAWLAKEVEHELHSDGQHLGTLHETVAQLELHKLKEAAAVKRPKKRKGFWFKNDEIDPIVRRLDKTIAPSDECLVCRGDRRTEEFFASQCVLMYADEEFRALYESEIVMPCRPHFICVVRESCEPNEIDYFLGQQIAKVERLSTRLTLFLERHAVERSNEPRGSEWQSWLKALEHFSCKQGVERLWDSSVYHAPTTKGNN